MVIAGDKVRLREKSLSDAQNDYNWSRDEELSALDAAPPLVMGFSQYLLDYSNDLRYSSTSSERFAIETLDGKHIGNCSYYNINRLRRQAELGIMIGDRNYWSRGYGTDTVDTLVRYVFQNTSIRRIYLKTLPANFRAQKCFKKCGFTHYSQIQRNGYSFLLMELPRSRWQEQQKAQEAK